MSATLEWRVLPTPPEPKAKRPTWAELLTAVRAAQAEHPGQAAVLYVGAVSTCTEYAKRLRAQRVPSSKHKHVPLPEAAGFRYTVATVGANWAELRAEYVGGDR